MKKILPYLRQTVWSGDRLGNGIGEAYLFSALSERSSRFENDLSLCPFWGQDVPLIKYIDAAGALSVQVHPSGCNGKDEIWIVDDLYPDAEAYIGFRREVTAREVLRCCEDGSILSLLRKVELQKGDTVCIPGGTIHAVRGMSFFEVQHSLDMTYRIFDYGRNRTLSLEKAMEHLDFCGYDRREHLCPFGITRLLAEGALQRMIFQTTIVVVMWGKGMLNGRSVGPRDCFLLHEGEKLCFHGEGELLLTEARILRKIHG